jgi:hypothetical protein
MELIFFDLLSLLRWLVSTLALLMEEESENLKEVAL